MVTFNKLLNFATQFRNNLGSYINRKRLKNKEFTIISNDCYGGELYKDLGLKYTTPFVGLMVPAPCYIELIKDLKLYLESPLCFINNSRYKFINNFRRESRELYPIGLLKKDIEIHFIHYSSESEVMETWTRRLHRINWDNIFVIFIGDKDLCTEEILRNFDYLQIKNKIAFTAKTYLDIKSTVHIKDYVDNGARMYKKSLKSFDVIAWLNGGTGNLALIPKLLFILLYSKRT